MNPVELSILISIVLALVLPKVVPSYKKLLTLSMSGLGWILIGTNLIIYGFYWQLVPAMVLVGWLLLKGLTSKGKSSRGILRWVGRFVFFTLFLFAVLFHFFFPMSVLPTPSGDFAVGVKNFTVVDSTRQEEITSDSTDVRRFTVSVWYPARVDGEERASYLPHAGERMAAGIAGLTGQNAPSSLLSSFFAYLGKVKTHSYRDAKLSDINSSYPMLIFNHGLYGFAEQNTLQMEHLASHGYIVFSINHTYDALSVYFNEQEVIPAKSFRSETTNPGNAFDLIKNVLEETDSVRFEEKLLRYFRDYPNSIDLMRYWSEDMHSLVNYLEHSTLTDGIEMFENRINWEQMGVFGMSMGGGAAVAYSLQSDRIKACASLDGIYFTDSLRIEMDVPFMIMQRDYAFSYQLDRNAFAFNDFLLQRSKNPAYTFTLAESAHFNYSDANYLFPAMRYVGTYILGNTSRREANNKMNMYLLAFFNKHVRKMEELELDKIVVEK